MKSFSTLLLASAFSFAALPALAAPKVIASIKPVHSLVSAVMGDVGSPELLIEGAGSPHGYQLKPSQAAALQSADLVFWIGPPLETFLERSIGTLAAGARSVPLIQAEGVSTMPPRQGGTFAAHEHEEESEEHAERERHEGEEHAEAGEAHHHDEKNGRDVAHAQDGEIDAHVWLDPQNARAFIHAIVAELSAADPENAAAYAENGEEEIARIDALMTEVTASLEPVKGMSFIVFHDAYHYFERRFGIEATGSITINPEMAPGAERVGEIRDRLAELEAACVFAEPQFEPKIIAVVTEGTGARTGILDPLGAELAAGPEMYGELIRELAVSFRDCLSSE